MCRAFEELIEQGRELGIEQGRELGIEQGAMENALNNAKSLMNKLNISLEETLDLLNLSERTCQYILEKIEK